MEIEIEQKNCISIDFEMAKKKAMEKCIIFLNSYHILL